MKHRSPAIASLFTVALLFAAGVALAQEPATKPAPFEKEIREANQIGRAHV